MTSIRISIALAVAIAFLARSPAFTQETKSPELQLASARKSSSLPTNSRGHLMMIGGGLQGNNKAVFEKMIACSGGVDKARFVVLPAASRSVENGRSICEELAIYGIGPDQAHILNVNESNATASTRDPKILDLVRSATAVYMIGGDQRRLVRTLLERDGSDTPLLNEMRKLHERGGLIAGTSAGASAQSQIMLSASGLPDMLVDEGLDTLDFGLTDDIAQRGLLLTKGLGFHHPGIVDQHFLQYRGRLGRLTRATADSGIPYGFGIDKNSAMVVEPDGRVMVVSGNVILIDPQEARGQDSPSGYTIRGVKISLLSEGDSFDPKTLKTSVASPSHRSRPRSLPTTAISSLAISDRVIRSLAH